MSYIGRGTESISNVEVLDNLTFNGSASYTLQKSSVNFVPSSANNLLISISGVVQQGNFSVSGSTITFDTTVSASDTCDWILHYGTGLITTVADGAITETKLGSNAVTNAKITDGTIANAKLVNSSITLNGSAVSLGGSASVSNTPAFQATRTANQTMSANTWQKVNFDSEIYDTDSAYDNSTNYRFTIPSGKDGKYSVSARLRLNDNGSNRMNSVQLAIYKNGSLYANMQNRRISEEWTNWSTQIAVVGSFSAGDYLEIYLYQETQGANTVTLQSSIDNSSFEAFKLIGA